MIKLKIGDYSIIAAVIICAVIMLMPAKQAGDRAVLYCDGKPVKTFDLSVDTEFVFENDYVNIITVKNGSILVRDADCPDRVCVYSGKISKSGQTICCLPNKVVIRVFTDNKETDVISG